MGQVLPGGTILPFEYHVGSESRCTILKSPAGLGDLGAPTAVGKILITLPDSIPAKFRSGILTTILPPTPAALSCANSSPAAISITPVSAANLLIRSSVRAIFRSSY